jgi:hypothetical protein
MDFPDRLTLIPAKTRVFRDRYGNESLRSGEEIEVKGRFMPKQNDEAVDLSYRDRERRRMSATVYLPPRVAVTPDDRIRWNGLEFYIVGIPVLRKTASGSFWRFTARWAEG